MKSKGFLICFTGIDGTGKTTLSKELVELVNKRGIKCKYVYARLSLFILKPFFLIGEFVFLHKKDIFKKYSEYASTKRKAIKKHYLLSKVYQQLLLFDYMLQIFFKIKLPLIFGRNIVCDRYIYDTVITDLSVDMNYSKERVINLLNKLFLFFPVPDLTFLIDVPEEIAYQRKDDTPSVAYLKDRRERYLYVGREHGMVILDGTKKLEELQCEIEKEVSK